MIETKLERSGFGTIIKTYWIQLKGLRSCKLLKMENMFGQDSLRKEEVNKALLIIALKLDWILIKALYLDFNKMINIAKAYIINKRS